MDRLIVNFLEQLTDRIIHTSVFQEDETTPSDT